MKTHRNGVGLAVLVTVVFIVLSLPWVAGV